MTTTTTAQPKPPRADPAPMSRREWFTLGMILLVGLTLRGLYLRELVDKPDFRAPAVDASYHDYWARGLATGDWATPHGLPDPQIRTTAYLRPPGYPYFLSLIYTVFGVGPMSPRVVQMLLGLVNVVLAYAVGRRWFGRRTGLVAAAFGACYWSLIYFEGELHAPVLVIYLLLLAAYVAGVWAERGESRFAIAVGALLGVAALVRPNVLALVPVLLLWGWWVGRPGRRVQQAAWMVLGAVVAIAPATIRNYQVSGEFVPISANAAINLFIGNNPEATGEVSAHLAGVGDFRTCYDYPEVVRNLEHKLGHELGPSGAAAYFRGEAMRFAREHPGDFAMLTLKKAVLFWGPREVTHNKVVRLERASSPVLSHIPGGFSVVFALAFVGGVLLVRERRQSAAQRSWEMGVLLAGLVLAYFLSVLPFFASARYRVPITPLLLILGAHGARSLGTFVLARDWRRAMAWGGLCAVVWVGHALAGQLTPPGKWDSAKWHFDRAVASNYSGQAERAAAEYRRTIKLMPHHAHAHLGLGIILARRGEAAEAVEHFRTALRLKPDYAEAHFNLGVAAEAAGAFEHAVAHYADALRYRPTYYEAHYNRGTLLSRVGRMDEAIAHYQQALTINPNAEQAHTNLALACFLMGRLAEAESHFREVVRITPRAPEAHSNLAITLARQGRRDEAVREYRMALRLDPTNETARGALAELGASPHP